MLDFLMISTQSTKRGVVEILPKFIVKKSSDLMIRGGDFYAIWIEERGMWSTDEYEAVQLIDRELDAYLKKNKDRFDSQVFVKYLWDASSGSIDSFHKYCKLQLRDSYKDLDTKVIFANDNPTKKDYASRKLSYPLEEGSIDAYNKIMSTIYDEEERRKLEWAVGAIVTGDSKNIQKFEVLFGSPGTGKSTFLNIVEKLFEDYVSVFDSKALASATNAFALEAFKSNPLVAIQHDGDLSKIEDNTKLNSIVSHETMIVNEKHKPTYPARFNCFLFMGTNKPVKITDAKSGFIRRLIDVEPTGKKLSASEYRKLVKQVNFELGAIAYHCKQVYLSDPDRYESYVPLRMLGASNDFYNFVLDSYFVFKKENGTSLKAAYEMYKTYCTEANVSYPLPRRAFQEELKNYFADFMDRFNSDDGSRIRSYYSGFLTEKFEETKTQVNKKEIKHKLEFNCSESIFDNECGSCLAQYASKNETPIDKWDNVKTILSELDTTKLHYVKVPENHIVIDFDIPDENGNKCFEKNLEAASSWPATYAELSKSGAGIHLHYIYTGDASKLSRIHDEYIEVKVFTGKSSLRRKLTKCNDLPVASISSGLALKGEDKMVNDEIIQSERGLRTLIKRNLNKEYHPGTKPSIDFIYKLLDDWYNSGKAYDVSDMRNAVLVFAANSSHQSDYCMRVVNNMKFKSADIADDIKEEDIKEDRVVFYDVEVFPNLFLVNWKLEGPDQKVIRLINPGPTEIEQLLKFKLIGYNNLRYDNHMLYACLTGYTNEQIYRLSKRIISGDRNAFFGNAYNLSYTDVYDYATNDNKKKLKAWEIQLGIEHRELDLDWDTPVPEELWTKVAEYCDCDVIATEAVHNHLKDTDFLARQILADLAGLSVNYSSNTLTGKIIFGNDKNPQSQFNYRNLGEINPDETYYDWDGKPIPNILVDDAGYHEKEFEVFDDLGRPIFPGYVYSFGKSTYRGEVASEGGYVYSEPGMYFNVGLLDITSMHPSSVIDEELFGPEYTTKFKELKDARVSIKHEDWNAVEGLYEGKLVRWVQKVLDGTISAKQLADALKIPINSVYGLTSAQFPNLFKDPRNKDNIVAKRGALFMINLKHAVQEKGYTVAHIKTDSIKIPNCTPEIIDFVMKYGEKYGYSFELEAIYEKMTLVNDAVYIAKVGKDKEVNGKHAGEWTATGAQFAVPYVFKKLFSKEPIVFEDLCEVKTVNSGSMYLDMNEKLPDVSEYEEELDRREYNSRSEKKKKLNPKFENYTDDDIKNKIAEGHSYVFIGRVGQYCPIKEGKGGGVLYRVNNGKNFAVTGTKGYRWLESSVVKELDKSIDINRLYYDKLVDDAAESIGSYGDFEAFIAD